eukprot:scaffold168394_cov31-Tisochrysis_lutea.AAC.2
MVPASGVATIAVLPAESMEPICPIGWGSERSTGGIQTTGRPIGQREEREKKREIEKEEKREKGEETRRK